MEFGGRKGKEDPQQIPHDARTPTTKETTTKECLFDFGRERSTTRIGQQLHLHERPTKDNRRNKRKRLKEGVKREREGRRRERELGLGSGVKGGRV